MIDPEYYRMEKKTSTFSYDLTVDYFQIDTFIDYLNARIETFIKSRPPMKRSDVYINFRTKNVDRYGEYTEAVVELIYEKTETDEEHKVRLIKDLTEMKEYYEKKVQRTLEHIANLKAEPLNHVSEDRYKEKRNKALTKLLSMSISDPNYQLILNQLNKYSPEGLKIENSKKDIAKLESLVDMEKHIKVHETCLRKTNILLNTAEFLYRGN